MIKVKKKLTRGDLSRVILETVKTTGLISVALVAPNVLVALKKSGTVDKNSVKKQAIATAKFRLIKSGFLKKDDKGYIKLTEKGEEKIRKIELANYELVIPKTWDKNWRVLIFDIPEDRRYVRQKVRNTLRAIGFYRLQDSVWVYPHDCAELVTLLKADLKVGKDLLYLVVDTIENDRTLKDYFEIKY